MHKLILGLIYYSSITLTCFGPLIEAIIRESKILECYKALWRSKTYDKIQYEISNYWNSMWQYITRILDSLMMASIKGPKYVGVIEQ
jgi:hypothetical protein